MNRSFFAVILLAQFIVPTARAADTVRWTHEYLPVNADASLHMDQLWFYGTNPYFSYALRTNKDEGVDTLTVMPGTPPIGYADGGVRLATWLTAGAVLSTNYHLEPISLSAEWNALAQVEGLSILNIFQGRFGFDNRDHKVKGIKLGDAPDTWIETVIAEYAVLDQLSLGVMWRFTYKLPAEGDFVPWHTVGPSITWRFFDPLFFSAWPYAANPEGAWYPGIAFSIGMRLVQ